ncbi:MAG: DUF480 domain-containing protein [Gammaproteobacteria bacterium]|nr:DUF480 domain-containing protein [Gammaproteobacteria bacterium]
MHPELDLQEVRVIGSLIEKQITTPDQYPLSLNALTSACNQKSNRDPVLALEEASVQQIIDRLSRKHLLFEKAGFGSRVPKYQQCFCNTEFARLKFTPQETAIVCELLLRGPQTPGELRSHAARMAPIADVAEVEAALASLADRAGGALVVRLPREPGRRESRYAHLFGDAASRAALASAAAGGDAPGHERCVAPPVDNPTAQRLAALEADVRELRAALDALRDRLGATSE